MPGITTAVANTQLDTIASTVYVQLHVGDPGADGTANPSAETTRPSTTLAAADAARRSIAAPVEWPVWASGPETITHISYWDDPTAGSFLFSAEAASPVAMSDGKTLEMTDASIGHATLVDAIGPPVAGVAAGAVLPITDAVPGTGVRYVATDGSDSNDGLTEGAPKATLQSAVNASAAGDTVVVRGGTYDLSQQRVSIGAAKTGLEIRAYPGETPVFDGTIAAGALSSDGSLRYFSYTSIPAKKSAEGIHLTIESFYPPATFSGGLPTGLAADRGFANVSGATSYSIPASQTQAAASGARVITGLYPDQCWAGDTPLIQVFTKALVRPGYFYVDRAPSGSDPEPAQLTSLYVHVDDTGGTLRVGKVPDASQPYFMLISADNVTIRGLKVHGHTAHRGFFVYQTDTGISGLTLEDLEITDTASTPIKLYGDNDGGGNFTGNKLVSGTTLRRVTISGTGWLGMSAQYTDDTLVTACLFENMNRHSETDASPKSGAIKGTKNHRMIIEHSVFRDCHDSHGLWFDQSNYDCTIASCHISNIEGSSLFWEISHKLLLVNNVVVKSGSGINVRVSGGSGVRMVNNTIVGGTNPVYIIAELRGQKTPDGRWYAEHTERYGSGSYTADTGYASSDLDMARGGAYATTNLTPGMEWKGGADELINNVIAHSQGSGMCLYLRPKTASASVNVPANEVVPALLDGNVYQSAINALAEVDVLDNGSGDVPTAYTLAAWRGATGLGQSYYAYITGADAAALAGSGYVDESGVHQPSLVSAHGSAAVAPSDAGVAAYVQAGNQHYGSYIADPE